MRGAHHRDEFEGSVCPAPIKGACDGPIRPDGSWMRTRIIGIPAHYANPSSSCSGGQYYSNCTYYPGGYVPEQDSDNETYVVRQDTVLPDEPGHMPDPAPAPPAPTPPPM